MMTKIFGLLLVLTLCLPVHAANYEFVDATSMGATFSSATIDVKNYNRIGIQIVVSAGTSPIGTFTLACSMDTAATVTNWTTIDGSSAAWSGNSGSYVYEILNSSCRRLKLVYTRTSGTATADVRVELKETGVPHQ